MIDVFITKPKGALKICQREAHCGQILQRTILRLCGKQEKQGILLCL
ncbi:MAG: hypothetical protein Q4F99_07335 [bacterium]|nr:hypothetical protein [bacterium]